MPGRRVIGVDVGGTKLLAGAVDTDLSVHRRVQRSVSGLDQPALLDAIADAVQETVQLARGEVEAVGFGIPSLISTRSGRAMFTTHHPLADVPFASVMAERLELPVIVDNDANLAALAEHRAGAARGTDHVVMLTVGTGIGGGLILGGELYRGGDGFAGELGHVPVELEGPPCPCGARGCLESLVSGIALAREAVRIAGERPQSGLGRALAAGHRLAGPLVSELAHDGDPAALATLELIGTRLGAGIAGLVNVFNPEVVVVGGGVIGAGELLLGPARAEVARRALPPLRRDVRVAAARFGTEAGMVGAAALAFDAVAARL